MSILSEVEGLAGVQGGGILELVSGLIQKSGGIDGLIATLKQGGLGGVVESWVGNGSNQPVTGQQLSQAMAGTPAGQHVDETARKTGVDPAQAYDQLAQHLPAAVDHLTPNGQVPAGSGSSLNLDELKGLAGKLGL